MVAEVNPQQPLQVSERKAAQMLGVSPKTLFNRRQAGKIGFVRDDGRIMYRLDELDRYSRSLQVPAKA